MVVGIDAKLAARESHLMNRDLTDLISCELALGEMSLV